MKEIWKEVRFANDEYTERYSHIYKVSNSGKVRNVKNNHQLKSFRNKQTGNWVVNLMDERRCCIQPNVARLVLFAFTSEDCIPFHLDGRLKNCNLWNLADSFNNDYEIVDKMGQIYTNNIEAATELEIQLSKINRCCKGLITKIHTKKGTTSVEYKGREVWLPNPNQPTIEVSTFGRIRDAVANKYISDMPMENIARLVCETFIAEHPPQDSVEYEPKFGHLGDNDCSLPNLRWGRK